MQTAMNQWLFFTLGLVLASADVAFAARPIERPAAANVARIACVGDSITFGHTIPDREHKSYPAVLAKQLGSGADVRNFGVNGATALKHGTRPYAEQKAYRDALA